MSKWHTRVYANYCSDIPVETSWEHVKALIGQLNGTDRTDVILGESEADPQRFLTVAGGNDGRYVIVVQEGKRGYYYLVRDSTPADVGEPLMVKVAELPDHFPLSHVHDLRTAVEAAEHYYRSGERHPGYRWELGPLSKR